MGERHLPGLVSDCYDIHVLAVDSMSCAPLLKRGKMQLRHERVNLMAQISGSSKRAGNAESAALTEQTGSITGAQDHDASPYARVSQLLKAGLPQEAYRAAVDAFGPSKRVARAIRKALDGSHPVRQPSKELCGGPAPSL